MKDVLFLIADSWKSIKSSTVTSSLYNDLRVGSHGDEKDTHTDQRVTTLITGDCRQLGLGHIVKAEIDVWLNWHNDIGTEALSDDQIINIITDERRENIDDADDKSDADTPWSPH